MGELPVVAKYILMILYARGGKLKGKLWLEAILLELSKYILELKELKAKGDGEYG